MHVVINQHCRGAVRQLQLPGNSDRSQHGMATRDCVCRSCQPASQMLHLIGRDLLKQLDEVSNAPFLDLQLHENKLD